MNIRNIILSFTLLSIVLFSSCKEIIYEPVIVPVEVHDTLAVGSIDGIVRYPGKSSYATSHLPLYPLWMAKVVLSDSEGIIDSTFTDKEGLFSFINLPAGDYNVVVSDSISTYFSSVSLDVKVEKDSISTLKNEGYDCILLRSAKFEKKKWTFIHFVNSTEGSIRRGNVAEIRIQELIGGSGSELNNIAFFAAGDLLGPSIYYLTSQENTGIDKQVYDVSFTPEIRSPYYLFNRNNCSDFTNDGDPGEYKYLEKIILKINDLYPADSIALFTYSHGSGIEYDFGIDTKGISPNPLTKKEISVPELRMMFDDLKGKVNIKVYVMSACYMGMYEVPYELKNSGLKYIVASPPTAAYVADYEKDLQYVKNFKDGTGTSSAMVSEIVEKAKTSVLSAYDMDHIDELTTLYKDFTSKINKTDLKYTVPLIYSAQKGYLGGNAEAFTANYYDMADFPRLISERDFDDTYGLKPSAKALYEYLSKTGEGYFIYKTMIDKEITEYSNMHGINMLLLNPKNKYSDLSDEYRTLKCYSDISKDWDEYLGKIDWDADYSEVWDGSVKEPILKNDVYTIMKPSELAWVAQETNSGRMNFSGKTVKIGYSMDLGGKNKQNWTPIGTFEHPFKGTIDGGNFNIKNLYISGKNLRWAGLIGYGMDVTFKGCIVSGEIAIDNSSISNDYSSIGGLCGELISIQFPSSIESCCSLVDITLSTGKVMSYVGGIAGSIGGSVTFSDCQTSSKITATTDNISCCVGGICGYVCTKGGDFPQINHCWNNNSVITTNGTGTPCVGGICGQTDNPNLKILNCMSDGTVIAKGDSYSYAGGILACSIDEVTPLIAYCINTGDVTADNGVAGEYKKAYSGGIGGNINGNIFGCANKKGIISVSSGAYSAGIVGFIKGTVAASCSYEGNANFGIAAQASAKSTIDNCYYTADKGVGEGNPTINNCSKFSSTSWPTDQMKGWGVTPPVNWPENPSWSSHWSTLGNWGETPNYPDVIFSWQ